MKTTHKKVKPSAGSASAVLLRRLLTAWLAAVLLEQLLLPVEMRDLTALEGLAAVSPLRMLLVTAAVFALLCLCREAVSQRWLLPVIFALLAAVTLASSFTWPMLVACLLVLALLAVYGYKGWEGDEGKVLPRTGEAKLWTCLTAVLAVAFLAFVSVWTVCRVRSFCTPSFDFSIFAQMFHSMRTTGLPITTIERDGPLSHFAVHMSPIYYLLLPFYCLWPEPETLQVLQAAVLASGVIPLWKLGKHHGLRPGLRCGLCALLLLYPAYSGGASYDIHENAFLTPLLLWLFYGIDRRKALVTALAAILTLTVKEDAAVYVAVVALYQLVRGLLHKERKWELAAGAAMLCGAVAYFLWVTAWLANSGDGVMTYRYKNFMYDGGDSLVTVILAVLRNPMKAVFECVDQEKLEFIGLTMLPLLGLPLLTRRYERFVLLIPYILVNLMSDYQYQHSIFFQYTYGATGCLFYMVLLSLVELRTDSRRLAALALALCISVSCFSGQVLPKALIYPQYCADYPDYYDGLREALDIIPEDASVAATTYYTTYLSQRDVLYDVRYASQAHLLECEYAVLNINDTKSYQKYGDFQGLVSLLLENGYEKVGEYPGKMEIYRKMPG